MKKTIQIIALFAVVSLASCGFCSTSEETTKASGTTEQCSATKIQNCTDSTKLCSSTEGKDCCATKDACKKADKACATDKDSCKDKK